MSKIEIASVRAMELSPGYTARIVHTELMSFSFLDVKAGSVSAEHSHPQEQVAMLTEGEFELTIEGVPVRFGPGSMIVIPSNVKHSGLAITDCKLMDVFTPVREDFKTMQEKQAL
ncbi:MAG: cupin domain-containing protein [Bacteroidota bacterium]